jgi:UDP-glucose 4-epimerase
MSRLIVVGKHGYIASALCRWFDERGVLYRALSSSDCDLERPALVAERFRAFGSEDVSIVFPAAINPWLDNSPCSHDANVRMVGNFAAAVERINLRRLIYLSTVDVYGNKPHLPITEDTPPRPDSWYGRAKYECEQILRRCEDSGAVLSILRLPGVYGPGENDRSVVGKLVREIRDKHEVSIHGSGNALRDYLFLDDLCAVITRLLAADSGGTWNVATGTPLSIREIASIIGEVLNTDFRTTDRPATKSRDFDLAFDNSQLLTAFPGLRFTSLLQGIRSYLTAETSRQLAGTCP